MNPVRLGVIGCGVIAQHHLRGAKASPQIEVVAVADVREEAAKQTAAAFGIPKVYSSAGALLKDKRIEAVLLAVPAAPRLKLARKAFARGKHVLTEKPVAMNAREVRKLIAARGNLVAGCCSSRMRFQPSAEAVAQYIASGALGAIRAVQCRCIAPDRGTPKSAPPAWRLIKSLNGGGILVNWGCYDLDYLLGICGWTLKPSLVLAQTWTVAPQLLSHVAPGSDAETHFASIIRCEGGEMISFERGEYCAAEYEDSWRIVGTKASLRLNMVPGEKKILADESSPETGVSTRTLWEGSEGWEVPLHAPVQDFAAAIHEGRPPRTSLEQALVVQQITDAIYASAAKGKAVAVR
jgi:UDP-N-acetyl-2-amino-2-deoxyglucuronate dehydrogenase